MYLFKLARFHSGAAAKICRLGIRRGRAVESGHAFFYVGDDRFVLDRTSRGNNHIWRTIVTRQIRPQACRVEGTHSLGGAENRTANRLLWKCRFLQAVED